MIEPRLEDLHRRVEHRRADGTVAMGTLASFTPALCFVRIGGVAIAAPRHELTWAPDHKANVRADAARSVIAREGLVITVVDEHHWRVGPGEGMLYWPGTGRWRRPDGAREGYGIGTMVAALREAGEAAGLGAEPSAPTPCEGDRDGRDEPGHDGPPQSQPPSSPETGMGQREEVATADEGHPPSN